MAERELVKCRRCWNMFDPTEGDGACPICLAREEDFLPSSERRRRKGGMFARPSFFSRVVARLQWDPTTIDLAPDARAWPELPDDRRRRLTTLLAGFCVAEQAVSEHLTPFAQATPDTLVAWVFFLQRRDEERHSQFFDRIAAEVLGLPGATPADRRAAARALGPAPVLELFEERLPAMAAELAAGQIGLDHGIAMYHMILEGNVFSAGQRALLEELEDGVLPGSPAAGKMVKEIGVPEGSLVISILRDGTGFVPLADSVVEAGDEVLLVLDTGLEEKITARFAPEGEPRAA